jgi:hypothetical protein
MPEGRRMSPEGRRRVLAGVSGQVLIGRVELVPPRLGVVASHAREKWSARSRTWANPPTPPGSQIPYCAIRTSASR